MLPNCSNGVSAQIRNIHYRYDEMNRLTTESIGREETRYRYDLCGNRLEKRKGGKTEKNCYNRKNQLICRETEEGSRRYIFFFFGNLIKEIGTKEEREYFYDTENRQIRISSGGRNIQENRYDGEGLRAGLTVDGKKSTFLYMNQNLYAEFDGAGEEVSRSIWGNGLTGLEWQGRESFMECTGMSSLVRDGLREKPEILKMRMSMMPLGCFWEGMKTCRTGFFTEGSSMTGRRSSIICGPGIIIL